MKKTERFNIFNIFDRYFGTLSMVPALAGLACVLVYPVIVGVYWSFTNMSILRNTSSFVGLRNYIDLAKTSELWVSMRNGVVYTFCTICIQILWGVGLALLLDRCLTVKVSRAFRLLFMVPWVFPVIVTVLVWSWLYSDQGIISSILFRLKIFTEPMSFLASKASAMPAVVFVHSWTGVPLMMMSTLAGLQTIPQDQYDVALIEGASPFHVFWYVILPNIGRILQVIIVLRCVWIFNNFNLIFLLTGGGPGMATQNLPIIAYRYGWQTYEMGKSSAVSVIMLILLFFMFIIYQLVNRKVKGGEDAF